MPIAMVRMLSVEISAPFPVWHISPTLPIWFSVLCMAVLCGGRSIFPFILLPHFPLSPFPFPLSPFPFPLSLSQSVFFLGHFCCSPIFPIAPLWCSKWFLFLCCHVSDCHRCGLLSTTGVQLFSKRGGVCVFCFLWRLFSLGGGGDGRHLIVGGGGWVGQGGGSCEEFGVDNGKGGGDLGIVSPNFL